LSVDVLAGAHRAGGVVLSSYGWCVDVDGLHPAPSPATTAAREVVARYSSVAMVNHCERSYLWSAGLGELEGIAYDAELLYVASMLHDLGLAPAFDNHRAPFEDAGGDVAWVFGAGAGWPAARRERVKEIIVRHMWHEVDPARDAEGHLLEAGIALDISGRDVDTWPADFRAEVLRRHPRLTLAAEFTAAFEEQARRKPGCAAAAAVASGVGARLADNPLG
jgi:predicted metal-dependent HD superfamily phosphohydrolase